MKKSSKSIKALASIGATAFLATAAQAVVVLQYEYNGTAGTQTPNPTLDTSGNGPVANGTLASGVTYAAGNSRSGAGTHANYSGAADGTGINFTTTGASVLNSASGATLFTDFQLTANITASTPRLIFVSTADSASSARAEIRINSATATTSTTGTYSFQAGGRTGLSGEAFAARTSDNVILNLNQWYTLATVLDYTGKTAKIYLNGLDIISGSESAAFAGNTTPNTNSASARIGTNGNTTNPSFVGKLDNTRIYNEALNASTIQSLSIPEPSTALLGALGVLALLRRRR